MPEVQLLAAILLTGILLSVIWAVAYALDHT